MYLNETENGIYSAREENHRKRVIKKIPIDLEEYRYLEKVGHINRKKIKPGHRTHNPADKPCPFLNPLKKSLMKL
jgi:hypothetical protein